MPWLVLVVLEDWVAWEDLADLEEQVACHPISPACSAEPVLGQEPMQELE